MTLRRLLEAPIADLTFADFDALTAEEAEEGPRLELKRELPAREKQADPWMSGGKLADPAKRDIAKEVVAFANAYGGVVVVGVDEAAGDPPRASALHEPLVPRVVSCAGQLQQALDGLIDPPLPMLEVRGIERPEGQGEGVIVLRTGPSTRSPHGYGRPPLAYRRRGSRSEPMTMRDLQDALFETRTRGERITATFEGRRQLLLDMMSRGPHGIVLRQGYQPFLGKGAIWFRCTLMAVESLQLRADALRQTGVLIVPHPGTPAFGDTLSLSPWGLKLNGIEQANHSSRHFARWFVGDHGIVDAYGLFALDQHLGHNGVFPPDFFPPVVIQVLALGEMLRRVARRPEVELVVECEFISETGAKALYVGAQSMEQGSIVPAGSIRIGPFTLGGIEEFQQVYSELERGIWHGVGLPVQRGGLHFPLAEWLSSVGET